MKYVDLCVDMKQVLQDKGQGGVGIENFAISSTNGAGRPRRQHNSVEGRVARYSHARPVLRRPPQGRKCKDGLINYRNACQQVNVGSLEEVIKYLMKTATEKAEEAQKAAQVCGGALMVCGWVKLLIMQGETVEMALRCQAAQGAAH